MVDAWNSVGYVHLRLGAYNESIDDYNHTLALKPELARGHRAPRRGLYGASTGWTMRRLRTWICSIMRVRSPIS